MLAGLPRESPLAARRWKNSRVKCNWPCTSYFLCSLDPIRPLEGLTPSMLKLLGAFSLCVEGFGARLLSPKEENQDYTPAGERWSSRSLWDTSISLAVFFCQTKPVISCRSSPSTPRHSLFQKLVHQGKYRPRFCREGLQYAYQEASVWSDPQATQHHKAPWITWEHRPRCNRDRMTPLVISQIFSAPLV